MTVIEILKYPNPDLRKKSKSVKKVDKEMKDLIADMIETMHKAPGAGLAAPQVGVLKRVIIADPGDNLVVIINPKITKRSGEQAFVEGCLSVPGLEAPVVRSSEITVKGLNRNGKPFEMKASGFLATVIQHEADHLDGKLFIDRVKDPKLIRQVSPQQAHKKDDVCKLGDTEECSL